MISTTIRSLFGTLFVVITSFLSGFHVIAGTERNEEISFPVMRLNASGDISTSAPHYLPIRELVTSKDTVLPINGMVTIYLPLLQETAYIHLPIVYQRSPLKNLLPAHGAQNQSPNVYLAWTFDEPTFTNPTFTVYLEADDDTPDQVLADGLARSSIDPYTFEMETTYYWQVVATDTDGASIEGPIWTFSTDGPFTPGDLETMVFVPAGEFQMGCDVNNPFGVRCDYDQYHYELPMHTVYVDAFHIDKYEVTNSQYRACVDAGACASPRLYRSMQRDSYYDNPDYELFPVLYVSNWDARDYCAWQGKRLPTEAEWEKAARGTIDVRTWPWGNDAMSDCTRMNYDDPNIDGDNNQWCNMDTTRVGSYPAGASPYGVMDMGGNVFEWVADLYDVLYYTVSPYDNPTGPEVARHSVKVEYDETPYYSIRGGSYRPNWYYSTVSHRHWGHHGDRRGGDDDWTEDRPYFRNDQVGFRCVKDEE